MAAAKESGAIEYSARLLLSLTSVLGESDMVEMNIVKNKLGPPHARGERIILRIDRARQEFHEDPDYSAPEQVERGAKKAAHRVAQSYSDAASLAVHLAHNPGLLTRALRAAANLPSLGGMGVGRCDSAKETLENALIKRSGPRRSFVHYLDGSQLPPAVLDKVPMHHRPKVVAAKPPGVEEAAPNDGAGLDAKSAPEA